MVGGSVQVCQHSSFHTYVGCHVTKSEVQARAVTGGEADKKGCQGQRQRLKQVKHVETVVNDVRKKRMVSYVINDVKSRYLTNRGQYLPQRDIITPADTCRSGFRSHLKSQKTLDWEIKNPRY
jgi:hypothetical protein